MEDKAPIEIPILIVIATLGIIVFIFFVVLFVLFYQKKSLQNKIEREEEEKNHQRQLVSATIEIAELERKRIAANLHDDVGGMINLVKLNIGKIARHTNDETAIKDLNMECSTLLEATMENIRSISRDLTPTVLMRLGFEEGLLDLCRLMNNTGEIKVEFKKPEQSLKIEPKTELQLYRIVQEIINNIMKHASASQMYVQLRSFNDKIIVEIKHNGKGISNNMLAQLAKDSTGIGLISIQGRAQVIKANVNYEIKSDTESVITIETPLNEKTN
ncbi:MAG TPA: ATP-binding protein [Bacteroidia bacterium]|nr:ATP-binding protein [Bacteroidia bacterium]